LDSIKLAPVEDEHVVVVYVRAAKMQKVRDIFTRHWHFVFIKLFQVEIEA
jgi:hypothetical protein